MVFVEGLINLIITKTKSCIGIDIDRMLDLMLELERLRLELEHKEPRKEELKC